MSSALPVHETHSFTEVRFRSLPQTVAAEISAAILDGRFRPGERLLEQKLARQFHIGTPTVREAFKELEHQGLVDKLPNRGTYVAQFSKQEAADMLEARMTLEVIAIRRATQNMTEADAEELKRIIDTMAVAARESGFAAYHQKDLAFHRKIWELSGNRCIGTILETLVSKLFATSLIPRQGGPEFRKPSASVEVHRRILEGLCTGDPERACNIFWESVLKDWKETVGVEIGRSTTARTPDYPSQSGEHRLEKTAEMDLFVKNDGAR